MGRLDYARTPLETASRRVEAINRAELFGAF